jgi:hypothetical protein
MARIGHQHLGARACSGGSTTLIWRNVNALISAAPRERSEPRAGMASVMGLSQRQMVTLVNGTVAWGQVMAYRMLARLLQLCSSQITTGMSRLVRC